MAAALVVIATASCFSPPREDFIDDPGAAGSTTASASTSEVSSVVAASTSTSGGDGGGGDTTSSTGGALPCGEADDGVCVPEPPDGWSRPVAVFENEPDQAAPSCELTNYPNDFASYIGEIDEGSFTCSCDCEPATGIICVGNATVCYHGDVLSCGELCGDTSQTLSPNVCYNTTSELPVAGVIAPTPLDMGGCEEIVIDDIDTATWGVATYACTGAIEPSGTCEAGATCTPRPDEDAARLCIVHAGDVSCPDVGFTEKRLRFDGVRDQRSCATCACGSATSECGSVDFTSNGCNIWVATASNGECTDFEAIGNAATHLVYGRNPSGTCVPSGGERVGEVTRDGTTTICCMP